MRLRIIGSDPEAGCELSDRTAGFATALLFQPGLLENASQPVITFQRSESGKACMKEYRDFIASYLSTRRLELLCILAGWTLYAIIFATYSHLKQGYELTLLEWWLSLYPWLIGAFSWAVLTLLVRPFCHRFAIGGRNSIVAILVHLIVGAIFPIAGYALYAFLVSPVLFYQTGEWYFAEMFKQRLMADYPFGIVKYWLVVGLAHGIDYYRRFKERENRALQLQAQLTQARLDTLRMQLNPHFLFNTLNSISVLMRRDVDTAELMLLQLSSFLRLTLAQDSSNEILLAEEIEYLKNYLEIETIRYQDRLTIHLDIDEEARVALVPHLIFQPLVENAIRHGVANCEADGRIEIRARRRNGAITLEVQDNGPGIQGLPEAFVEGIGLSNTRARLNQLYGSSSHFELRNSEAGGVIVTATIPFHTDEDTVEE